MKKVILALMIVLYIGCSSTEEKQTQKEEPKPPQKKTDSSNSANSGNSATAESTARAESAPKTDTAKATVASREVKEEPAAASNPSGAKPIVYMEFATPAEIEAAKKAAEAEAARKAAEEAEAKKAAELAAAAEAKKAAEEAKARKAAEDAEAKKEAEAKKAAETETKLAAAPTKNTDSSASNERTESNSSSGFTIVANNGSYSNERVTERTVEGVILGTDSRNSNSSGSLSTSANSEVFEAKVASDSGDQKSPSPTISSDGKPNAASKTANNLSSNSTAGNSSNTAASTAPASSESTSTSGKRKLELKGDWSENIGKMSWDDAKKLCEENGMRLPTIAELKGAKQDGTSKAWSKDESWYWSSEDDDERKEYATNYHMEYGSEFPVLKTFPNNSGARCHKK